MKRFVLWLLSLVLLFALAVGGWANQSPRPVLKPLDKVRVTCEQEPSLNRDYIVTSDGFLLVNFIGAVRVVGLTEEDAAKRISEELIRQRILKEANVTVRIVDSASRSVRFRGSVKNFGETPWRDGLRLSDIVKLAEPTAQADLTRVQISAVGGKESIIDFKRYDGTNDQFNPLLRAGDEVVFNQAMTSESVYVLGAVTRPGALGYVRNMSLRDALEKAGGLTAEANQERIRFERKNQRERVLNITADEGLVLQAGDRIVVEALSRDRTVFVTGGVVRPGLVPFVEGMTLTQAIARAGGNDPRIKPGKVTLVRQQDGKQVTRTVDVAKINQGFLGDVPLQPGDRINVPVPGGNRRQQELIALGALLIGIFIFGG